MAKTVNNITLFNAIWDNTSESFKSRVPRADATNIKEIGMLITAPNFTAEFNEWLTEAINRIGLVLIRDNTIYNRLSKYIYGTMEFGDAIEELMVNVVKGEDYESGVEQGSIDPFRITNPEVKALYHRVNSQRKYRVTTYPDRAKRAFLSENGLQSLLMQIVAQLTKAGEIDDWLTTKEIFNFFINDDTELPKNENQIVTVSPVIDEDTGKDFVESIKNIMYAMSVPTGSYNQMGIPKMIRPEDVTIFIRADILNRIGVRVLASAFNPADLDFTQSGVKSVVNIEPLDNFGGTYPVDASGNQLYPIYTVHGATTGQYAATAGGTTPVAVDHWVDPNADVIAVIAENQFLLITRQLERADSIWNPEGLYWNNFLHRWSQYGYSGFMNAVIVKGETTPPDTEV